ncbi:PH domain-containing protein [Actinomadura sp. WMMB 499]|uniref:PH domain-containing protein n=1 Tax=Actinomadura sp. WMMB 499 TaxID=1219491 RepID=UPI001245990C|nr:PH domain-containing protein [Actinomadura sp. WMMB 499]QFG21820.1 PH domain-containing protein [Actinomadura sp. WMMB 499]
MTIRSTGGRVAAFAWLAFAALNIADLAFGVTGDPEYSLTTFTIAALLLLGSGIAYTIGLRPAIIGDDAAVTVRNPLRDTRAPWRAVRSIEGKDALVVRFAGPDGAELRTRAWVHQTSPRAQAKAEARARKQNAALGAQVKGRTPAGYAADQLNEMRDRLRPKTRSGAPDRAAEAREEAAGDARGTVTWSLPAVAALAVPALAVVACVILALVN